MKNKKLKSAIIIVTVLTVIGVVIFVALKLKDKKTASRPCGAFGVPCTEEMAKSGTAPVDAAELFPDPETTPPDLEAAWDLGAEIGGAAS